MIALADRRILIQTANAAGLDVHPRGPSSLSRRPVIVHRPSATQAVKAATWLFKNTVVSLSR